MKWIRSFLFVMQSAAVSGIMFVAVASTGIFGRALYIPGLLILGMLVCALISSVLLCEMGAAKRGARGMGLVLVSVLVVMAFAH